jgi:hypothetical protein
MDSVRNNLGSGSYAITVIDANGCSDVVTAVVDTVNDLSFQFSETDPTCQQDNGSLQVIINSGTAPFTYGWNTGSLPDTGFVSGLGAGSYVLTLTDANSCVQTDTIAWSTVPRSAFRAAVRMRAVVQPMAPPPSMSVEERLPLAIPAPPASPDSSTLNGLTTGTYTVTVTDALACTDQISIQVDSVSNLGMNLSKTDAVASSTMVV